MWTDSISRDVNAVNQCATRDVTLPDGTVRKVHLKLKVNQFEVAELIIAKLAVHPAFNRRTLLAKLRTKIKGVALLDANDEFSLATFVTQLLQSCDGQTMDAQRQQESAYMIAHQHRRPQDRPTQSPRTQRHAPFKGRGNGRSRPGRFEGGRGRGRGRPSVAAST